MKTTTINFWVCAAVFPFVFYDSLAEEKHLFGINILIFNLLIIGCLLLQNKVKDIHFSAKICMASALVTAFSVGWFGDWFSVLMNLICLLLVSFFMLDKEKFIVLSVPKLTMNSLYVLVDFDARDELNSFGIKKTFKIIAFAIVLPVLIVLLFLGIYANINQHFKEFADVIFDVDFNLSFVGVSILGILLMYWFWYYRTPKILPKNKCLKDSFSEQEIAALNITENTKIKELSGKVLFICLNLILFALIGFDVLQIISDINTVKQSYQYSQSVHHGIYALIFSIFIAIVLILVYLNKTINFVSSLLPVRLLAKIWIVANLIIVIANFYKNYLYINAYGLTYKRLGVYAFLSLCILGLVFTGIKVYQRKRNHYLIKHIFWVIFLFGVAICPINWSAIITKTNLQNPRFIDYAYLFELGPYNTHILTKNKQLNKSHHKLIELQKNKMKNHYNQRNSWPSTALYFDWVNESND